MRSLFLGVGEVGQAYYELLSPHHPTFRLDVLPERTDKKLPRRVEIIHVCLRWGPDFMESVRRTIDRFLPDYVNIMSTVPVGTTETIDSDACHSTTRGLHPALKDYIRVMPKHIGGSKAK